jgi:serine/threonine-protein kinase
VAFVLGLVGSAALAQTNPAAEDLFRQGRELMKQDKPAEACPKFEASQRLDPAFGTLMNLGNCYEKLGRIASAWVSYNDAVDLARRSGQQDRVKMASERAGGLAPRLPRLQINLPPGAAPGLEVRRNGQVVDPGLLGTAVATDPGDYTISAVRPGLAPWSTDVKVKESATTTVDVTDPKAAQAAATRPAPPATRPAPPTPPPPARPVVAPVTPAPKPIPVPPPAPAPTEASSSSQKLIAYAVGGAGLVALGVGGVFGLRASSKWSDAQKACDTDNVCSSDDAKSAARVADVLIGVGIAAVGAGVILYLTAPKESAAPETSWRVLPSASPTAVGVTVGRGW